MNSRLHDRSLQLAERLLRLVVSPSVAAAIVGDLEEDLVLGQPRRRFVRLWLMGQVVRHLFAVMGVRATAAVRPGHARTFRLESIWRDLRYAFRQLRRTPAFAVSALLVLGLGIGVNTAVFSLVNAVFYHPPPVLAPDRLVYVYVEVTPGHLEGEPSDDFTFFRSQPDAFAGVTFHSQQDLPFRMDSESGRLTAEVVTASYFDVLGVAPELGRTFRPEDDLASNPELAAVISHDMWTSQFHSDPQVLGRQIRLANRRFVIIGVLPSVFTGLSDPWTHVQAWVTKDQLYPDARHWVTGGLIGRLKPGEPIAASQATVDGLAQQMLQERIQAHRPGVFTAHPYVIRRVTDVRTPFNPNASVVPARVLAAVTGVAALVLLIGALNVAGLVAARGIGRAPELAARRALGAGAGRLVRQLTTEGILLALAAGFLGGGFAAALIAVYRVATPVRYLVAVPLDLRVLGFAIGICVGTGLLISLLPARQALGVDVVRVLNGLPTPDRSINRRQRWIVAPQISASFILLVGAGLYIGALADAEFADRGYTTENVVNVQVEIDDSSTSQATLSSQAAIQAARQARRAIGLGLYQLLFDRLQMVGGPTTVAMGVGSPAYGTPDSAGTLISHEDFVAGRPPSDGPSSTQPVSPGYFRTLGITLLAGREVEVRDTPSSPHVAVISENLARRLWPGQSAVGRSFARYPSSHQAKDFDWLQVVGVAHNVTPVLLSPGSNASVWTPITQQWGGWFLTVVMRTPATVSPATVNRLKAAIMSVDPARVVVTQTTTMKEVVADQLYERRTAALILSAAALFGVVLGAVGLYGMVSYGAAQQRQEIGVRATLGASRGDLLAVTLRAPTRAVGAGLLIGVLLMPPALRLASQLSGMHPAARPSIFIATGLLMLVVTIAACYVPARSAAEIDPMDVLRAQ